MKARKTMKHAELIQETIKQVSRRFQPNVPDIKKVGGPSFGDRDSRKLFPLTDTSVSFPFTFLSIASRSFFSLQEIDILIDKDYMERIEGQKDM